MGRTSVPHIPISACNEHPFGWNGRRSDHGALVSVDGTPTSEIMLHDVTAIVAYGDSDGRPVQEPKGRGSWDGDAAGIARLVDGRFIAWESWWGPTGSGFSCDAYGGDAEILFGASPAALLPHLTEKARELLVFAADEHSPHDAAEGA